VKDIDATRARFTSEKEAIQKECEDLKERISVLEDEKSALAWTMQKDLALLNERLNYSEYQKNQIQKEREEGEKRLQNALEQLKKFNERLSEENEAKRNQSDKKYYGQIEGLRESFKAKEIEYE
jgi:chromosome segregation ATPase